MLGNQALRIAVMSFASSSAMTCLLLASLFTCGIRSVLADEEALRWEKTIARFEAADRESPPKKGGLLFLGSSSIRMWKLNDSFPRLGALNRGFGGSQISDSIHYFDRVVLPYRPETIVFYAGDNDIAKGESADSVLADYKTFAGLVHKNLPKTRLVFVAIKPSLSRWKLVEPMRRANAMIEKFSQKDPRLLYADIDTPMIGDDGKPKKSLFIQDGLHLSSKGYEVWTAVVKPLLRARGKLLLATCQFPVSGNIVENARWIRQQLEAAAARGADLVHFSESALSGYPNVDYDPKKQPRDWKAHDKELRSILELSKKLEVWVALGSDHKLSEGNKPHNSLYVINPRGEIVDRYDKRFCTNGDLRHYSPGDHFTSFDVNGVKCGLLICYDVRFPELYRKYHVDGVRLMLHSFHNARQNPGSVHPIIMPASLQTRAATNNMFVSATNSCASMSWPSLLATPDGRILRRLGEDKPGVMITEIDTEQNYYDASAPFRRGAIDGKLNSGTTVDDPRSKERKGF